MIRWYSAARALQPLLIFFGMDGWRVETIGKKILISDGLSSFTHRELSSLSLPFTLPSPPLLFEVTPPSPESPEARGAVQKHNYVLLSTSLFDFSDCMWRLYLCQWRVWLYLHARTHARTVRHLNSSHAHMPENTCSISNDFRYSA